MLSERSRTTTPIRSGGTSVCSLVCGLRDVAAAARTSARAPPASTRRTSPVRRMTDRNPRTSCVSTAAAGPNVRRRRPLMSTAVPVRVDGAAHAHGEPARLLDLRVVLRPGERACRARELRMVEIEDLGDELERAPPLLRAVGAPPVVDELADLDDELQRAPPTLRAVAAPRVVEQLERLLERREHDHGLGFRLGLRHALLLAARDGDERQHQARSREEYREDDQRGQEQ